MNTDIIHNDFPEILGTPSNFYEYRKTALRWIQLLSGKEWTDYNAHDPGITILEALCYTLTEIEYKLDFSIEDILASLSLQTPFKLQDNAFYLAENIMTCAPVTLHDYRKLIIDQVAEINNAWFIPKSESGNKDAAFEILLLKKNQVILPETAINNTLEVLKNFKAYGEKVMAVKVAEFTYPPLQLDLHIRSDQNAEEVLAQVFFNINEDILNPNPHRQSFSELEAEGLNYDTIFEGPQMNNGIVTKENLENDLTNIHLVRIKKIITATEGVEMVDNFGIDDDNITDNKIKFPIIKDGEYFVPFFSPNPKTNNNTIRVFTNHEEVEINNYRVLEIIVHMAEKTKRNYVLKNQRKKNTYILQARDRNIEDYYSIKNDFPNVYGLNEKGFSLIQNRNLEHVDQLKAFLIPYEQLLADSLTDLSQIRNLFSVRRNIEELANQPVIIQNFVKEISKNNSLASELRSLTITKQKRQTEQSLELMRRNRYLTHLLARFDGYFHKDFEVGTTDDSINNLEKLIFSKEEMLDDIEKITSSRSIYDYQNHKGVSSLEKELYLRLIIPKPPKRPFYKALSKLNYSIGEISESDILEKHLKKNSESSDDSFIFEFIQDFSYEKLNYGFHSKHDEIIEEFLKAGISKSSYKIISSANKKKNYVILGNSTGTLQTLISIKKSQKAASEQVSKVCEKLVEVSKASEGFYLVDHSLLNSADGPNYSTEEDDGFTRFRMSFIFPKWPARFQNRSFRKHVESLVAKLVPAHIRADCFWLNLEDMTVFEKTYSKWFAYFTESVTENTVDNSSKSLYTLLKKFIQHKRNE